jgi:hypothetical protein
MSSFTPRLETSIRTYLLPHLKEDSFTGSGRTFRRVTNGWIQVVNVQGSRYGGQFAVNLGIHPTLIPDVLGIIPDVKKFTEPQCEFRRRLAESGGDQWWKHDATQESMDAAVIAAAEVYARIGRPLMALAGGLDCPFNSLTAQDFSMGGYKSLGFGSTNVRMALALARLRKAEGKLSESKAFAAYGLAHVGSAGSLSAELKRLSNGE